MHAHILAGAVYNKLLELGSIIEIRVLPDMGAIGCSNVWHGIQTALTLWSGEGLWH